jgi:hypothetical protein
MKTWVTILSIPNASRPLAAQPTMDLDIWIDVCASWGILIWIGQKWQAWKLLPSWRSHRHDIGWLESVAIELIVFEVCSQGLKESVVPIHVDKQGSIGQFWKGRG